MKFGIHTFAFTLILCGASIAASPDLYSVKLNDIDGNPMEMTRFKGKVLLVVNVASKCGYTPQYKGLEQLYKKYKEKGLVVVAVPSNDFGGQEPGSASEIKSFCEKDYGVTFPIMSKVATKGEAQHPLFNVLTGKESPFPGDIKWNFTKFLIGRDGKILKRFESAVKPDSAELETSVQSALNVR